VSPYFSKARFVADLERFWMQLMGHPDHSVGRLAGQLNLSVRQLERLCNGHLGQSPKAWLKKQRMAAARQLVLEKESIKAVALELGFHDTAHFSKAFKGHYGQSPERFVRGFYRRRAVPS